MSPLRGEEFTGRTVEEAIERGLRSLGRKRTEVDIEILEKGKPANVLGMGGEDARVLLSFQEDERPAEPDAVIDEAEVPRHADSVRGLREEDSDEASPAFAEQLAVRASGQAVTLEPMLAYERRIVHLSVQGQQGLKTESVGMEPNRRVVISSTAPGARGPFRESGPGGSGFRPRPTGPGGGGYGPRRGYGPRPGGGYRPRPERGP